MSRLHIGIGITSSATAIFAATRGVASTTLNSQCDSNNNKNNTIVPWMPPHALQQHAPTSSFFCQKDNYILTYKPTDGKGAQWMIKYDSLHRTPKWCLSYHPPKETNHHDSGSASGAHAIGVRAKASFHADQRIDLNHFRVKPNDYLHSGYDRGHMIPAADFHATQEALQSTFTMANMVPQSPLLNKGFWAKLEGLIRYLHDRQDDFGEMVVITGPVYAPVKYGNNWMYMHKAVGTFPRLIQVPTHFFKVIIARRPVTNDTIALATASTSGSSLPHSSPPSSSSSSASSVSSSSGILGFFGSSRPPVPNPTSASTTTHSTNNTSGYSGGSVNKDNSPTSSHGSHPPPVVYIGAFLVPNSDDVDPASPLAHFAVRLDHLEALVGFSFFGGGEGSEIGSGSGSGSGDGGGGGGGGSGGSGFLTERDRLRLDASLPPGSRDIEVLLSPALFAQASSVIQPLPTGGGGGGGGKGGGGKKNPHSQERYLYEHMCHAPHMRCHEPIFAKS